MRRTGADVMWYVPWHVRVACCVVCDMCHVICHVPSTCGVWRVVHHLLRPMTCDMPHVGGGKAWGMVCVLRHFVLLKVSCCVVVWLVAWHDTWLLEAAAYLAACCML